MTNAASHDSSPGRTMPRRSRRPAPATVVAFLALFVAISGPALAADTIFSEDIVDGQVKTRDVANDSGPDALTGNDVATNVLTSADFAPNSIPGGFLGSLTGSDFANDSLGPADITGLTGADVDESTLTGVANSVDADTVDGIDSSEVAIARGDNADAGQCDGSLSASPQVCADVTVTFPHGGQALVTGTGSWHRTQEASADAECAIRMLDQDLSRITIGEQGFTQTDGHVENFELPFTLQAVTGFFQFGGTFDFQLVCQRATDGDAGDSDVDSAYISVLVAGS